MSLRYLSVCSGIEAATVAWSPLGFTAVAFSEVEPFPCAVLAYHYPGIPNLGDMTRIDSTAYRGIVDILVGGTPCQAFSTAGLRQGLEDARGNLTITFLELANAIDPDFVVWENVPGVLSDKTNAFGCLLGGLVGADNTLENVGGWPNCGVVRGPRRTAAWRVLDAQYFGLAQRRQRVFLVACPRNGADPAEVLFERQGVQRHSAPSREAGEGFAHDVAPCIGASGRGFARGGDTRGQDPVVASCVTGPVTHALKAEGFDGSEDGTGRGQPIVCQEVADTLTNCFHKHHGCSSGKDSLPRNHVMQCFGGNNTAGPIDVATARNAHSSPQGRLDFESETFCVTAFKANAGYEFPGRDDDGRTAPCLQAENQHAVAFRDTSDCLTAAYGTKWNGNSSADNGSLFAANAMQVRRLTPRECERLQGFPDDYTLIPWKGKPAEVCPDGPRYKALGNSMAVPCMRWIGERIKSEAQRVGLQERDPLPLLAMGGE